MASDQSMNIDSMIDQLLRRFNGNSQQHQTARNMLEQLKGKSPQEIMNYGNELIKTAGVI